MNIIQSFWTKPTVENRWGVANQLETNVWLCAASCLLAQKNGAKVTMYTDKEGFEYLKYIPYDDIKVILDEPLQNVPRFFWAAGKFVALKDAPIGSVHIDNDVLLFEEKTVRALNFVEYDVIVQQEECVKSTETIKFYQPHRMGVKFLGHPKGLNPDHPHAYNVGVIGFNNEELRDAYIDNYYQELEYISRPENGLKVGILSANKMLSLDLIFEQTFLHQLTSENGFHVKCLLNKDSIADDVERLNYRHLLGGVKYQMLPQIKELVKELDNNIYKQLNDLLYESF